MATVSARIPIGAEGTCPACKQMDATQKVSVITHAFANALTPAEFEAISFSRSRGEITDWAAPRGTAWDVVTKQLALPERPAKPWILRLSFADRRGQLFLVVILLLVSFLILRQLPLSDGVQILAPFIITLGTVGGLGSYARCKQKEYDAQLLAWGAIKSKWSGLRYCARDNLVFIIGQTETLQPVHIQAYLNAPD